MRRQDGLRQKEFAYCLEAVMGEGARALARERDQRIEISLIQHGEPEQCLPDVPHFVLDEVIFTRRLFGLIRRERSRRRLVSVQASIERIRSKSWIILAYHGTVAEVGEATVRIVDREMRDLARAFGAEVETTHLTETR